MKILAVHNRYLWRGGEDESFEAEVVMLRAHGHVVEELVADNKQIEQLGRVRTAMRTLWSHETYRHVRATLRRGQHDLVYAQNTFPLVSPSLYYAARAEGVPVIQTLRNYRLACLNGLLFRDGEVCEDCVGKAIPWPGIVHGCYRDSRLGSSVVAAMLALHRALGTYRHRVDAYVALTEFSRDKFIEAGLPSERIVIKPNFLAEPVTAGESATAGYALYAGRLAPEKGLDTLLAAFSRLGPRGRLVIAGDGPLAAEAQRAAASAGNIEYVGRKGTSELRQLLRGAAFLVFPSKVFENLPRIILEAFACGVPVITSRHGSMATLVEHMKTGLHFTPADDADLANQMTWAWDHMEELAAMRRNARAEYLAHYTADANYEVFERIQHLVRKRVRD